MNYFCNPVNINYRYQFNMDPRVNALKVARESADPSMILFKGTYYIFSSMNLSVWCSEDMANWESHSLPNNLPLYDYAPDVRVIGDYVYFSASKRGEICNFYRTKDVINGPYEEIEGTFDFWDPNIFEDDDKRIYFYWGCSNTSPIWGVELDRETMKQIGEPTAVINGNPYTIGYERFGEDHSLLPVSDEEIDAKVEEFLQSRNMKLEDIPESHRGMIRGMFSNMPFIEGAWMNKHNGKYYLQYSAPGTQYNIYNDGVYISDSPLGPFELAMNNPYSYKPGGFIPGAGHGSTMEDTKGNFWHTSTMRISMNHDFERRVGIWPAGFDKDGDLYCNQRYGDWPMKMDLDNINPWAEPEWFLLSYNKKATASSYEADKKPELVTDENVQTWWRAKSSNAGEWIEIDLEKEMDVNAIQVNFADDKIDIEVPGEIRGTTQARYIDETTYNTRWKLEGSIDGKEYFVIEDKSDAATDLPHDLVVTEEGIKARYIKLTIYEIPYDQQPCISGLRVFGLGSGSKPAVPSFSAIRTGDMDMNVKITGENSVGYNVLWGHEENKLYHSKMTFDACTNVGALVKGREYFIRVDAFNESGITKGDVVKLGLE
ncbi:MAG: family 43 glycosylhydrolase [Suipraeoptans sp.]